MFGAYFLSRVSAINDSVLIMNNRKKVLFTVNFVLCYHYY